MSDNSTISNGDSIAADDISGVKFQRIKLVHGDDGTNAGDVSLTNPYPTRLAGMYFPTSVYNNTTTNLAAGASWSGNWEDVLNQPAIQILGESNQPMKYTLEQAIDAAGTDLVSTTTFTRSRGEDLCENVQLNGNYVRVTIKNLGSATTTSLELNCTFGPLAPMPQALSNYGNQRVSARETQNFNRKLRDAMEVYPNAKWPISSKASGDLIQLEGNALGASYLSLSLDPLTAGTESYIESDAVFKMPIDMGIGIHASQRTYGQEMSVQVIASSDGADPTAPAEVQISSIQQATTTLTVNCATPHNLRVGSRIGIYGVNNDSRLNYAALIVATCPTATQFTVTAGTYGTLATLTVGPFSPTAAFVYQRDAMSYAANGTSLVLEGVTSTQASYYAKSEGGDAVPIGGTPNGSHSVTVGSSSTGYPIAATTGQYIGRPSTQHFLSLQADRLQWSDATIDSLSSASARASINQVVPNPDLLYKLRLKVTNRKGLTVPVAKVVSAAKTGTTTATITTATAHNLTVGDYINVYGNRDQTNFANLTTATVVASVINSTSFTVVWGSAVTATGYGGFVAEVQGQQTMQGMVTGNITSYSIANSILTLVGTLTWSGASIGDLVNLHGVRVDTTGADAGIDGVYRIRDFITTSLVLEPVGSTTIPTTQASVNVGGAVIRRTDMRVSFVRIFDYERLRVETLPRPANDVAGAVPVVLQGGGATITQGSRAAVGSGWYVEPDNILVADIAAAAFTTAGLTNGTTITPTPVGAAAEFNLIVTSVSGTAPTMDVVIQESDDSGTNWYDIYHFPRIVAGSQALRSPVLPLSGNRLRWNRTVGGTTPSFTIAHNRITHQMVTPPVYRQIYDRVVVNTTLNATTATLLTNGALNAQLVLNMGAITTTAPAFQLQGSDDNGATWYSIGTPLTGVASSTVQITVPNINAHMIRATVSTAGVASTLGYVLLKAYGV